ncbi:6404_t:CDS:1, partial [Scutellospora calospora]
CDETSIAILKNKKALSNITISQILEQQNRNFTASGKVYSPAKQKGKKVYFSAGGGKEY